MPTNALAYTYARCFTFFSGLFTDWSWVVMLLRIIFTLACALATLNVFPRGRSEQGDGHSVLPCVTLKESPPHSALQSVYGELINNHSSVKSATKPAIEVAKGGQL